MNIISQRILFLAILLPSYSAKVNKLFMGKESSIILIDLPGTVINTYNNEDTYAEWTIETQIDRILFLTLSTTDGSPLVDKQLQSLTLYDADQHHSLSPIPFTSPHESESIVSPSRSVYTTDDNSVVIKYHPSAGFRQQSLLQLKIEKAADCPVNIGGLSFCGRITDQVSCYCATFNNRTWDETRAFCNQNGMRFAAIESYTEDMAIWNAWGGGQEVRAFWIGLSDFGQEGKFVWEATRGLLSAGYQNWQLGQPDNAGGVVNCGNLGFQNRPGWNDFICDSNQIGGICELQP